MIKVIGKVNINEPSCIIERNGSPYAIRAIKTPFFESSREGGQIFNSMSKDNILYYISREGNTLFANKQGGYKTRIGDFIDIPSTMIIDDLGHMIIYFNHRLIRINPMGNIISNEKKEEKIGHLILDKDNNFYLLYSLLNDIHIRRYNPAMVSTSSNKISFSSGISLVSATSFKDDIIVTYIEGGFPFLARIVNRNIMKISCENNVQFYYNVFSDNHNYFVISQLEDNINIKKYNNDNHIVANFNINNQLPESRFLSYMVYGGINNCNIYFAFNNFLNNEEINVINLTNDLRLIWKLKICNALINEFNNSVVINGEDLFLGINRRGDVFTNNSQIDGNLLFFKIRFPNLIGVCTEAHDEYRTINFIDPSSFNNLVPGVQYYLDNIGNIVFNSTNNTYLGTAVSKHMMILK